MPKVMIQDKDFRIELESSADTTDYLLRRAAEAMDRRNNFYGWAEVPADEAEVTDAGN